MPAPQQPVRTTALGPTQAAFLALLHRIELHARITFRHERCPDRKEDRVAETVALAWRWFVRLRERGRDASLFASALTTYAARAVRSGRRLCGQEPIGDALSPLARTRKGFTVSPLPDEGGPTGPALGEALADNSRTPVPDQVAFRHDFPAWRRTRTKRDRRLLDELMMGERTGEVAARFGLSAGRVSQLRREFLADWRRFCGDAPRTMLGRPDAGLPAEDAPRLGRVRLTALA